MASWKGNYTPDQIKSLTSHLIKQYHMTNLKDAYLMELVRKSKSHSELAKLLIQTSHALAGQLNAILKICEDHLK